MKALLTTSFLMCATLWGLSPAQASSRDPERAIPSVGVLASHRLGARPLARYLATSLELAPARAAALRQAMHQRATRTPGQLAECLQQVLTPAEFAQLLQLRTPAPAGLRLALR